MFHTEICDLLGIRYPILQGAMQGAGGPRLVAATSEAGGLGILPTFGGTEEALRADIEAARALTDKPVAVNITPMGRAFTESRARICVEMEVPIVTTGRADPGQDAVGIMKEAGITVVPVIPSVEHALRVQDEGVDAVIASGSEAGGHVGTVATLTLVPQVVDAVDIPVLAAGGIGDGRGFLAMLALGAVGVQLGTVLIATEEAAVNDWYRNTILEMKATDTIVSKVLTGATVRCIATPEIRAYEEARLSGASKEELQRLRQVARQNYGHSDKQEKGRRDQGTAGQVAGMITRIRPTAEIIEAMIQDAAVLSADLAGLARASAMAAE
ncbi:MAG: nitronate monooxygenase [Alphaproteobacteria bacterium]|jgi:enoyl-[acyl-carrier protein] reductase II|nr:nitronate monooxygenase [Alphaproteobacteria bacterium]